MAYSLVTSASAKSGAGGGGPTTAGIDTTGANLIVLHVSRYTLGGALTVSDSKGNTWTALTEKNGGTGGSRLYYCAAPTVGAGHTFTAGGTSVYASIEVMAFSGAAASPFDQQNGASTASATSLATGSLTPPENNCLIVAGNTLRGLFGIGQSQTVDSGVTRQEVQTGVANEAIGGAIGYKIQTTAAAINPTWSWATADESAATIATFKAAATGNRRRRVLICGGN